MNNFVKDLEEYFKNTPIEKVLEDWEKTSEYDEGGVLVRNFIIGKLNSTIKTPDGRKITLVFTNALPYQNTSKN